jgi:hypothetical protein
LHCFGSIIRFLFFSQYEIQQLKEELAELQQIRVTHHAQIQTEEE